MGMKNGCQRFTLRPTLPIYLNRTALLRSEILPSLPTLDLMFECPFCKAEITEDTARFGGHCPSCLIEIPGEEAATDPGVAQAAEEEPSANRGPLISGIVAAAVVLVAVGYWHTQQTVAPTDTEPRVNNHVTIPLSSHQNRTQKGEAAADPEETSRTSRREERSERRNRTGGQAPADTRQVAEGRVIPKAAPLNPLDAFAVGSGPNVRGPKGIVLSDVGQIEAMVGRVLSGGQKRLDTCYQQKASVQPGYSGVWFVSVDVARDGSVEGMMVSARKGEDAAMERCIRSHVKRWTFQRIA